MLIVAWSSFAAFAPGHCYEPFVKYGNYTTSDAAYPVGTVVEFGCEPGYTLEQGSVIIECVDMSDPQWNETEPACRGTRSRVTRGSVPRDRFSVILINNMLCVTRTRVLTATANLCSYKKLVEKRFGSCTLQKPKHLFPNGLTLESFS